jgi:sarcosine oxidase subunit alpha
MRLAADAAHQFGGIELDRSTPLRFKLNGRPIDGFAGDTVLTATLAAGIDGYGTLGETPIGLTDRFSPLVVSKHMPPLPMDLVPAIDGAELSSVGPHKRKWFGREPTLGHRLDSLPDAPWLRDEPARTLEADLLVIGAGVAGLAAADAAAADGHRVLLVERHPWLGGDARYFGPVGDDETPETVIARLSAQLRVRSNVTILTRAEIFTLQSGEARAHQIMVDGKKVRGEIVALRAARIVLATGALQRLPVFPGNRAPGVLTAIGAYHLAKRYGVAVGPSAIVATQSNHGYRLAMRLSDAGVKVGRVTDTRIHPQSRFVDFAKASGLTLASGQYPVAAERGRFTIAHTAGAAASTVFEASQLIVSGPWQPDLGLWMLAGGAIRWAPERSALIAAGQVHQIAIAGSAAGFRSMLACVAGGRAAAAHLFGGTPEPIEDAEAGTAFETPDGPAPAAAVSADVPSFLDGGRSLAVRPAQGVGKLSPRLHAIALGDVAASVELGLIAPTDAGAIAEERGAPGGDLVASTWRPSPDPMPDGDEIPAWLAHRFGAAPKRLHLVVDHRRQFAVGTLVYPPGIKPEPESAIGVIVAPAEVGGIALIGAASGLDRFVLETAAGPSPARIAKD